MIHLDKVSVYTPQRKKILDEVSLDVRPGEFIVLSGPSGGGKSTITRLMNGLIYTDDTLTVRGKVLIDGQPVENMESWLLAKQVGSVFQDPRNQFFASLVKDEMAFFCENFGMAPEEIKSRIDTAAREQQLIPLLDQRTLTLSSGEKQMVAIASIRVARQTIYILDEPSANLSLQATRKLAALLQQWKQAGHTIVLAEHRLHYITHLLDRLLLISGGKLQRSYTGFELTRLKQSELADLGLRPAQLTWIGSDRHSTAHAVRKWAMEGVVIHKGHRPEILLDALHFSFQSGEIVMLTGSNGIGKTSLARFICGLSRHGEGRFTLDGQPLRRAMRSRLFWYVMQEADYQLFSQSVWDELFVGIRHTESSNKKAESTLRILNLWKLRARHPATLSGGEKQRLTFAVALMSTAPVIILDEPTSGLDWRNLKQIADCLRNESAQGRTFLIITHDYDLISLAGTRLIHLLDHRLHEDFPLDASSGAHVLHLLSQDRS